MTLSLDADLAKSNISQVVVFMMTMMAGGRDLFWGGARCSWCAEQARPTHTCVLAG